MNTSLESLAQLHREVSERSAGYATAMAERWGHPSGCGLGCSRCCQDDLTVFTIEAERIRHHHTALLAQGEPHPTGACAFLDGEGGCRIYPQRPYVCRTQGLPLRWLEPDGEGGGFEYRDICPLNESEEGIPLVELPADAFWTIGHWESRLRMIQQLAQGDEQRVALRALFAVSPGVRG